MREPPLPLSSTPTGVQEDRAEAAQDEGDDDDSDDSGPTPTMMTPLYHPAHASSRPNRPACPLTDAEEQDSVSLSSCGGHA